jgi:hypothetical protein
VNLDPREVEMLRALDEAPAGWTTSEIEGHRQAEIQRLSRLIRSWRQRNGLRVPAPWTWKAMPLPHLPTRSGVRAR